jgi:F-type H+-transporting ATPase subunit epsilon
MARPFQLDVVTPDRVVMSEPVTSLVVPGVEGYLGVLAGHAPLVTQLETGAVTYRTPEGDERQLAVSGGFLEVGREKTTILADTAERVDEIDLERARRALERAREAYSRVEGFDEAKINELQTSLKRALNRVKLAGGG